MIGPQVPSWLRQAPASQLKDFRDCLINSNLARHDLKALLGEIQSPEDFARPRLRAALTAQFFTLIADENAILVREWKNHHLLGLIKTHARTTRQTLLEAALQNFEASEAQEGGMETGTAIYNVTATGEVSSSITGPAFAKFCRNLDLGGQYLAHIFSALEPSSSSASGRTPQEVRRVFRAQVQHAFGVAIHIAYMNRRLTAKQHLQLNSLYRSGSPPDMQCHHLTINEVVLPGVLVIEAPKIGLPFILYTPDDPSAALRPHASLAELKRKLAERLLDENYRAVFERLVPLQHQGSLLDATPEHSGSDNIEMGGRIYTEPAHLNLPVDLTACSADVFLSIAEHTIAQIKSDAQTLAALTANVDVLSRQKRLQGYIDAGKSVLFFAASFIPVVGEVLLVVSAAQLIDTIYEGFSAWSRGDSDEALNDLLDVADNLALAAATAGAIKTAGFTAGLIKVRVRNKGWRLWHSDLTPYRHPDGLPEHLVADSQGLYQHGQQQFLKLDDHAHAVRRTAEGKQWELAHPTDPHAYSPPLLSNQAGGWRHLHETPGEWEDIQLIKRLGPDATQIKQAAVEPILLLCGVDKAALRQIHQEMVRPPPLLLDTLNHFNLEQEINDFDLSRAEGTTLSPHSPQIQFHLLTSLAQWPANRVLKIVDEQQQEVLSHGTGTAETRIDAARFRRGELLHALQEQLPQDEFNALLPPVYIDYFTKVENLARTLEEQAVGQKQRLFTLLTAPNEKLMSPTEKSLHTAAPTLSKRHLEDMQGTLSQSERQQLEGLTTLPNAQRWEAEQYAQTQQATRLGESIFLECLRSRESVPLVLHTLERIPGWPKTRLIEVHDVSHGGPLLGRIGTAEVTARDVLIRQGELYALHNDKSAPMPLLGAIERMLPESERSVILQHSGADSLEQALYKTGLSVMNEGPPPIRTRVASAQTSSAVGLPLDPLFSDPSPPLGLTLRADGIHQAPPLANGNYRYYIQDNQKYYQVKYDTMGWHLLDARSRFRAYQPYLRQKTEGGWEIDQAKGALLGGKDSPVRLEEGMESGEEFESAESVSLSSDYESAEEGVVRAHYSATELSQMRTHRGYQYSQNYRRIYDRANNGRYPLRDTLGRPMRIRQIQSHGKSLTTEAVFAASELHPYIRWQGYENVARLYEDKLEVTSFTAAHQKCAQEASLIGEATVVTRRALKKGQALGVYGGELLPLYVARARQDPYLMPIKNLRPTTPHAVNMQLVLSGDNALSRINTIFEYEGELPIRQANVGYNVEAAQFRIQAQVDDNTHEQLILTGLFASEDIASGAELRWNYQYDESTIRELFPRP